MKNYSTKELIQMFWKSIILILVLAILGGGAMGYRAKKQQHTTYSVSQEIVISHNLNENQSSDNGQDSITNADMNMMPTYAAIAEDETISKTAHKMLPKSIKKHYSVQDVNDSVKAIPHQQSLVLTIRAKADSAKAAVEIANATAKAMKKDLPKSMPWLELPWVV